MFAHACRHIYKLTEVCKTKQKKEIKRGEEFVCRVYRRNVKSMGKSMKGRASKLSSKISMSGKYYYIHALRCESVKFDMIYEVGEKTEKEAASNLGLPLCC